MSNTRTVRLPDDILKRLREESRRCLIRMSELYPRHVVITTDEEDFRGYRRNKREAIPLLCPPKK